LYDINNCNKNFLIFFNILNIHIFYDKIEEIYLNINILKKDIFFENSSFLNIEDKRILLSIIIFKSINKISINPSIEDINFINSDKVINNIVEYCSNFSIYYHNTNIDEKLIKKESFKKLEYLLELGIIKSKIIRVKEKTVKEFSFGFENLIPTFEEYLGIAHKPYTITKIDDNYYLIGDFFTKVYKIFKENIRSGFKFELNSEDYLKRLANTFVYKNQYDLDRVMCIIEKNEKIDLNNIIYLIIEYNNKLKNLFEDIKILKKKMSLDYKNMLKKEYYVHINNYKFTSIYKNEEYSVNLFLEYSSFYLKKEKKIDTGDYLNQDFKLLMENCLLENIMQKNKEKNNKFVYYTENNEHYSKIFDENDENLTISLETEYTAKNVKEYSMVSLILSTPIKEINKLIIKNVKKIKKIDFNTKKKIIYEKNIDTHNIDNNICGAIFNKFLSFNHFNNLFSENYKIKVIPKLNTAKSYQAKISSLLIYNNLNILKKSNIPDNVPIYIPFFFDFRGRFYYYSNVSPTNFKYSRYIFNYGIYSENEINELNPNNKVSVVIEKYYTVINDIINEYDIKHKNKSIKEAIF
jgi:hypothetical protein